jgi:phosphoglycerol transferase MdoB-like AlkP superfamily enzyme
MAIVDKPSGPPQVLEPTADRRLTWGSGIMALAGIGFIGYALIFFVRNFTDSFLELGIGPNEVDVGKDAIRQFSPSLYEYISHLHIAVSGFIAAAGLATAALAWFGVRRGLRWAWVSAVATPVLGLAVALPAHYPNDFDTLGHLGLIYADTLLFVVGALLALRGLRPERTA